MTQISIVSVPKKAVHPFFLFSEKISKLVFNIFENLTNFPCEYAKNIHVLKKKGIIRNPTVQNIRNSEDENFSIHLFKNFVIRAKVSFVHSASQRASSTNYIALIKRGRN